MNFMPASVMTSAGGKLSRAAVMVFTLSGSMATSLPCAIKAEPEWRTSSTNTGSPLARHRSTGDAIAELRRISGLTWEQLAGLLQVSRRALHFWATDKQMHAKNEHRVHRLLAVLRQIDRGFSSQNRTLLLSPLEDGVMPFDLLRDGCYQEVLDRLGEGRARPSPRLPPMSSAERTRRRPPPTADLLDAQQGDVHKKIGRRIRSHPIRKPKEK